MNYNNSKIPFTAEITDRIAIVKLTGKVFDLVSSIEASDEILKYIKSTEFNKEVKALLFINEPDAFGLKAYDEFLNTVLDSSDSESEIPNFCEKNIRFREINILNNIIRHIFDYQKLCFIALQGEVVTPLFGVSLSLDFRFVSSSSSFILAHKQYGLHPSGALPFFLTHQLGYSKAMDILLSDSISASQAQELGLVNKVFSESDFESQCIEEIRKYMTIKSCTIRDTKRLTHYFRRSLEEYFKFETSILNL